MSARIVAVCSGRPQPMDLDGRQVRTAIDKQPRTGPVPVDRYGLDGDAQADEEHHGGLDQALYAYGQTDADHWVAALHRELPPGCFGENLRISGLEVSAALVGERWVIGDAVQVAVTAPRIPCRVFAGFWDVPDLVSRFLSAGRPGAYLRVVTPGAIAAGMRVKVVHRPDHDLTVAEVLRIRVEEPAASDRLLAVDGVAGRLRSWAEQRRAG